MPVFVSVVVGVDGRQTEMLLKLGRERLQGEAVLLGSVLLNRIMGAHSTHLGRPDQGVTQVVRGVA